MLLRRDTQRRILELVAKRAGVDLGPAACWVLAQIDRSPEASPLDLARIHSVDPARLRAIGPEGARTSYRGHYLAPFPILEGGAATGRFDK